MKFPNIKLGTDKVETHSGASVSCPCHPVTRINKMKSYTIELHYTFLARCIVYIYSIGFSQMRLFLVS
ncbi:MAG: hypothetical protein HY607_07625 [Planctomycetes bacterium]|nr:hypothetical protein [Planctomycetota bacterium]